MNKAPRERARSFSSSRTIWATHRSPVDPASNPYYMCLVRALHRRCASIMPAHTLAAHILSRTLLTATFVAAITLLLPGCVAPEPAGPGAPMTDVARDPAASARLSQEAASLMQSDPARAESLLRAALDADLYNGPAHNNLGTLHLARGNLYEAASEFEWARKLMPGHPDPRLNLALTLERAGRTDEALATYATALEIHPEHIPTIQAMTRLQLRASRTDDRTPSMLDQIALRGETQQWRDWATLQRARIEP